MPAANELAASVRSLRRFAHLNAQERTRLFEHEPAGPRDAATATEVGNALGGVLYSPATTPDFGSRLLNGHWPALTAAVLCLEDAIGDSELEIAEQKLTLVLKQVKRERDQGRSRESIPYLFVRVREPHHLEALLDQWGTLSDQVDGIVLPKVTVTTANQFLTLIRSAQRGRDRPLWAMPILEGPQIAHAEHRIPTLLGLSETLSAHRELIPCLRVGAADLSGIWGVRRTRDFTIYDVIVVANVIADIVNIFGRATDAPPISGPVWEYIREHPVFKPPLRETPFREEFGDQGPAVRRRLLSDALDGLVRETLLDRLNGLHGKTAIHPSHLAAIDAVSAVSAEEFQDAQAILNAGPDQGARTASTGQRMNEPKPHALWAQRTLARARAFGVLRGEHSFLALLPPGAP